VVGWGLGLGCWRFPARPGAPRGLRDATPLSAAVRGGCAGSVLNAGEIPCAAAARPPGTDAPPTVGVQSGPQRHSGRGGFGLCGARAAYRPHRHTADRGRRERGTMGRTGSLHAPPPAPPSDRCPADRGGAERTTTPRRPGWFRPVWCQGRIPAPPPHGRPGTPRAGHYGSFWGPCTPPRHLAPLPGHPASCGGGGEPPGTSGEADPPPPHATGARFPRGKRAPVILRPSRTAAADAGKRARHEPGGGRPDPALLGGGVRQVPHGRRHRAHPCPVLGACHVGVDLGGQTKQRVTLRRAPLALGGRQRRGDGGGAGGG